MNGSNSGAALAMRVTVVVLGIGFFLEEAQKGVLSDPARGFALLAPAFFLWALWGASSVFVSLSRGDAFAPAVVRGMNKIGAALMLGAFSAVVVQPSMAYLIGNGFVGLTGVRLGWSVENITLAMVGFVLVLLAREGAKLKANLEQFV